MKTFAVLQLSGCAGCEVGLLNSQAWIDEYRLLYMPLVISVHDMPDTDRLLISGGVRTDEDVYNLRRAVRKTGYVVAIGTCAISGGIASLGNRDNVRELFFSQSARHHVPRLLPRSYPIDEYVSVDLYLPGCPPTPELFHSVLSENGKIRTNTTVCAECRRKKIREIRPVQITGFQQGKVSPEVCLIKQGFLCIGTSTRNGCGAPCPRAGHPCVGCRGPSNALIGKGSDAWFESIKKVFVALTDIPDDAVEEGLRSPQLSLFLFQFSDYARTGRLPRPKEKVV